MNIFVLDNDIKKAAQYHCDSHVVKMVLETAQLLCTTHRLIDKIDNEVLYKATHVNHPAAIWVRQTDSNYRWTYNLFVELCNEYTYRYGKIHKTEQKLKEPLKESPKNISNGILTPQALCMPDEYKTDDIVQSYRNYYKTEKRHLGKWRNREIPEWWS